MVMQRNSPVTDLEDSTQIIPKPTTNGENYYRLINTIKILMNSTEYPPKFCNVLSPSESFTFREGLLPQTY
jgi:hypothetical protein